MRKLRAADKLLDGDVGALATVLFECLNRMDSEASKKRQGYHTGLSWYGGHYRRDLKRPQTETCWTCRLHELLPEYNYFAEREVQYPGQRARCDLRIQLPNRDRLWLEVKGAWKDHWCKNGGEWIYKSYLFHPLVAGLDVTKTHTAALDMKKLKMLKPEAAEYVGLLLVGLDSELHPIDADFLRFEKLARLNTQSWQHRTRLWSDVYRPGCRVNCHLWYRKLRRTKSG